jgi:transcriptional regulator with XRE-family HTH domain
MGSKQRPADRGADRARSILVDLGNELRHSRQHHGLSQAVVGRSVGISPSQVSRIERAQAPRLSICQIARLLAVVGLELSARAYAAGPPVRDAAHRALLDRLRARISPEIAWRYEVPVGHVGDPRAWDAVLLIGRVQVAVEAETRPSDVQALQRRLAGKRRDDPEVASVILLLADTRHNRVLIKEHGPALEADLPMTSIAVMAALARGSTPGGNGIVLL